MNVNSILRTVDCYLCNIAWTLNKTILTLISAKGAHSYCLLIGQTSTSNIPAHRPRKQNSIKSRLLGSEFEKTKKGFVLNDKEEFIICVKVTDLENGHVAKSKTGSRLQQLKF